MKSRKTSGAGTWVGGRLAFAFPTAEGGFDVVAETVDEDEPSGTHLLAQAVAFVLAGAAERGGLVKFDGHVTDPHLHPILASLPHHRTNPVELMEL